MVSGKLFKQLKITQWSVLSVREKKGKFGKLEANGDNSSFTIGTKRTHPGDRLEIQITSQY